METRRGKANDKMGRTIAQHVLLSRCSLLSRPLQITEYFEFKIFKFPFGIQHCSHRLCWIRNGGVAPSEYGKHIQSFPKLYLKNINSFWSTSPSALPPWPLKGVYIVLKGLNRLWLSQLKVEIWAILRQTVNFFPLWLKGTFLTINFFHDLRRKFINFYG